MGSPSVPSISQLWEGRTIDGKFALLEWFGGNDTQGVFLTLRQGLHRAVIKIFVAEGEVADAYISQWEAARLLSHRHLMPIFETGRYTSDGTSMVYIVTECADRVLSQFIQDRPLKPHEATNILYPIVDALSYVHAKGFVHGHVKPPNILVAGDELKLSTDNFRLAAGVPTGIGGPDAYDAPEVASGVLSPAADVWSVGMTLIEALTQQPPSWDPTSAAPPAIPQSLPLPFAEIVPDCLRWNPTARCILSEIRAQLVPPTPQKPLPSPDELAARVARPMAAPQHYAPEPVYHHTTTIAAESIDPRASIRWRPDEVSPRAASQNLFADIEESSRRSRIPLWIGVFAVLLIAGVVLVQSGLITVPPILANFTRQGTAVPRPATSPTPTAGLAQTPGSDPATPSAANTPQATQSSPGSALAASALPDGTAPASSTPAPTAAASTIPTSPSQTPSGQAQSSPSQPNSNLANPVPPASAATPASVPSAQQRTPASSAPISMQGQSTPDAALAPPAARPRNADGEVVQRVMPTVSPGARSGMQAPVVIVLRVFVNRDGTVSDATYVSHGPGNYFAKIAQRAAEQWKFNPPLSGGRPQPSTWELRFYFSRSNTEANAEERGR
jgi:serine/threonine protein kinase